MRSNRGMAASENIEHESTSRATPSWIVVTSQELSALWKGGENSSLIRPVQHRPEFHVLPFGDKQRAESDASQGDGLFHRADHSRGRSSYQPYHRRQCD